MHVTMKNNPKRTQRIRFLVRYALFAVVIIMLSACASTRYEKSPKSHYGIASWYGSDFHGKPTSSGEPFDMYAKTCAHKTYPFGTRLRVTNVANDRSVVCVVNDRGPFVKGRDIDLSYAAARKIKLTGIGVGEVMIEPAGRDTRYVKAVQYQADIGTMTIQVGSFSEFENAERLQKALELRYSEIYIKEICIEGDTYYRVRIGKFSDRCQADDIAKTLADEGYDVLITRYDEGI
jgi:rare lipoprotein A